MRNLEKWSFGQQSCDMMYDNFLFLFIQSCNLIFTYAPFLKRRGVALVCVSEDLNNISCRLIRLLMAKVSSDRDSGLTVVWQILTAYFSCIFSISEELLFFTCDLKKTRSTSISPITTHWIKL